MRKLIMSTEDLGQVVKKARKAQGLSQEEVAGMCNTGRRFISDLENGKANSQIGKTLHVISALGLTLELNGRWST